MGNPSFRQRRRRGRPGRCEIRRHRNNLSMLNDWLGSGIVCKRRMALVMGSRRAEAGSSSSSGCRRSRGHYSIFDWRRGSGRRSLERNTGWDSRGAGRLVGLLWPLFLIRIGRSPAGVYTRVSWRRRAGGHALEILLQDTDLRRSVALVLSWVLLRRRAADWVLRLGRRNGVHALVYSWRTRRGLIGRLCRRPGSLGLGLLVVVMCQPLRGRGTLNLGGLEAGEGCRARDARRRIPGLDAASWHASGSYDGSLRGRRRAPAGSGSRVGCRRSETIDTGISGSQMVRLGDLGRLLRRMGLRLLVVLRLLVLLRLR